MHKRMKENETGRERFRCLHAKAREGNIGSTPSLMARCRSRVHVGERATRALKGRYPKTEIMGPSDRRDCDHESLSSCMPYCVHLRQRRGTQTNKHTREHHLCQNPHPLSSSPSYTSYALDVVEGVLEQFSDPSAHTAWHGACLALAELAMRGLLLPEVSLFRTVSIGGKYSSLFVSFLSCASCRRDPSRLVWCSAEGIRVGRSVSDMPHITFGRFSL